MMILVLFIRWLLIVDFREIIYKMVFFLLKLISFDKFIIYILYLKIMFIFIDEEFMGVYKKENKFEIVFFKWLLL